MLRSEFHARVERARQRTLIELETNCALRTLIRGLPRRAQGMSEPARFLLAEHARDAADLIERGLIE